MSSSNNGGCGCLILLIIAAGIGYSMYSKQPAENSGTSPAQTVSTDNSTQSGSLSVSAKPLRDELYSKWSQRPHVSGFDYLNDLADLADTSQRLAEAKKSSELDELGRKVSYYIHPAEYDLVEHCKQTSLGTFKSRLKEIDSSFTDTEAETLYKEFTDLASGLANEMKGSDGMALAIQFSAVGKGYITTTELTDERELPADQLNTVSAEDEETIAPMAYLFGMTLDDYKPTRGYILTFADGKTITVYGLPNGRWSFVPD